MIARSLSKMVVFNNSFLLRGIDRHLSAGSYRVVTDEQLIKGISFPVYRRVGTVIFVPAPTQGMSSIEMVTIDPLDLQAALERDAAIDKPAELDQHHGMATQEDIDPSRSS